MLRIRIAAHDLHVAADAGYRRTARGVLCGSAINLLQLGIVDSGTKAAPKALSTAPM
jgi:hypothetical protein